jgi:RNA exonuclease 1
MGKGYKLTSASGDGPKTCAFFFSDKGCRNGANCKFSHESAPTSGGAASGGASYASSSSVVSSETESDGEIVEKQAGAYASLAKKQQVATPKSNNTDATSSAGNPFWTAPVVSANEEQPSTQEKKKKKKRKKNQSDSVPAVAPGENIFDLGNEADNQKGSAASPPKKQKKLATPERPTSNNTLSPNGAVSFRNLQLPIASFSLPTNSASVAKPTSTSPRPPSPQHEPAPTPPPLPLPQATPAHLKWKDSVISTRKHDNYQSAFDFEKKQQDEFSQGISSPHHWFKPRPYGDWCKSNPAAIAIDCEMCETKDPVTGAADTKALCRISIVNADEPSEVLLDTLVKPEWPVSNHRTWVNGITAKDLENVKFTLRHAQQFMQSLCSDQTVVVGHAVHNDLLALRMKHHTNVDTAMLYVSKDEEESTPSLKNLAYNVLKRQMPEVHDSVNDARVALQCAEHYRSRGGKVEPVEKVFVRKARSNNDAADTTMLLVHRLPTTTQPNHLVEMFLAYTAIKPKNVPDIMFSGSHGKCNVEFTTKEHAELAYNSLVGEEREDKTGKKQKRVSLKGGGYVCVRKMKKTK